MIIQQISIFLENKQGQLFRPYKYLSDNKINITTACLADTSEFGILRLIVKDYERAVAILRSNGYAVVLSEIVAIVVPDCPGGLSNILEIIDTNGINIEYMYAISRHNPDDAILAFRFTDPEAAIKVLQKHGVKIATQEQVWS